MKKKLLAFQKQFLIFKLFLADYRYVIKYARGCGPDNRNKQLSSIMLLMHALEKGMSFRDKKQNWGTEKADSLVRLIADYLTCYEKEETIVTALHILNAYLQDPFATDNEAIRSRIAKIVSILGDEWEPGRGGVFLNESSRFDVSYEQLLDFYRSRRSVRYFSRQRISDEEIERALGIAQTTPSACNRQSCRLYSISDPDKIKSVLDCQLGGQGWCDKAPNLFVITSNVSCFGAVYEREQPYIDGGMFAMNFNMGLHAQKIASCFKMYVRTPQTDNTFRTIVGIPPQETPIVLILAGHPDKEPSCSPISRRNKLIAL